MIENRISDRAKILLIDEDTSISYLIRRAMEKENYKIYIAGSGKQGMEMSTGVCPDLILMDGGKGHVNAAIEMIRAMDLDLAVAGMAKDDHHRTRSLVYVENGQMRELRLREHPLLYKYMGTVQEEVHRFAIDYHRGLRGKRMLTSVLDEIEGIGPAKRGALLDHFGSVERIKQASVEELREVKGITEKLAEKIREYFHC